MCIIIIIPVPFSGWQMLMHVHVCQPVPRLSPLHTHVKRCEGRSKLRHVKKMREERREKMRGWRSKLRQARESHVLMVASQHHKEKVWCLLLSWDNIYPVQDILS